jgi:cyanate permease
LLRQPLILPGESQETWLLAWQPQLDKACYLSAGLYDENGDSLVQAGLVLSAVGLPERITNQVLLDSTQNYRTLPAFAMLVLVSGLAGWVFWQRQRLGLESNENEHG